MEIKDSLALTYTVQSKDLASDLPIDEDDNFPEVFATSRMIALMELAAARLMKPILQSDELSVGVNVNVNHLAATPNNQEVKAVATYIGMVGKLYQFEVELHDKGGIAGSGTHTRAIVKTERLVQGAIARVNKP
ncbi:thioesterase family protein [Thalassotalea montiporae]